MIYNAEGEILSPLVVHKGDIPQGVQQFLTDGFCLVETGNGQLSENVLMEVPNHIQRYM